MLTALATVVLVAGAVTVPAPRVGDIVVGFDVVDRTSSASAIGVQRLSRDGKLLWGDGKTPVDLSADNAIVRSPALCDDGEGGVLIVYEYEFTAAEHAGDCDLVMQRIGRDGKLLWDKPKPVAASRGAERHAVVVSDGLGGAIVVYEWTNQSGDSDILVQRVDGNGQCLWNGGLKPVQLGASGAVEHNACAIADGRGGALVFFEWVSAGGDVDIMARHVTADGRVLWGSDERALDVAKTDQIEEHAVAVSDGLGGAIVVFESEPRSGEYQGDRDIAAQRVSPDGVLLWNSGAAAVVSSSRGQERNPAAIADGAGGVIVAFEGVPTTGENMGDSDILAQRLDAGGKMLWNNGERSVPVSTSKSLERAPVIVADGGGGGGAGSGAIIVCEVESRTGERAGDVDIVAQRLSGTGAMLWNEGDRPAVVANSKWREQSPRVFGDGEGGVLVVHVATAAGGQWDGDADMEAARLDASGKLLWNAGERSVDIAASKQLERNPSAIVIGAH